MQVEIYGERARADALALVKEADGDGWGFGGSVPTRTELWERVAGDGGSDGRP